MSDWFEDSGRGPAVDVGALFDSSVPVLLAGIVSDGALVSVGTTSDGGAVGITVTLDGRWRREYFRDSEEAAQWLTEAALAVKDATKAPAASSAPRRRSRRS